MATPYIDKSASAKLQPFQGEFDYAMGQAHSMSGFACGTQAMRGQKYRQGIVCGEGGVVASCPQGKSVLDTWVTGYQNSIHAVNGGTNFPWPEQTKDSRWGCQRMAWQPKLLTSSPGLMKEISFQNLDPSNTGAGYSIKNVFGLAAPPAAFQSTVYGLSEDQAVYMQKHIPPRQLTEPRAGTWIR